MNRLHSVVIPALLSFTIAGCGDDGSKKTIQPARTYAAPAKKIEKAHQMSRPIGCNGNPYYFDHETKQWFYYTLDGQPVLSPNQPPCQGADAVLNNSPKSTEQLVPSK